METERVLIDGGECPLLDNETLNISTSIMLDNDESYKEKETTRE